MTLFCGLMLFAAVAVGNALAEAWFKFKDWWNRDKPDFTPEKIAALDARESGRRNNDRGF